MPSKAQEKRDLSYVAPQDVAKVMTREMGLRGLARINKKEEALTPLGVPTRSSHCISKSNYTKNSIYSLLQLQIFYISLWYWQFDISLCIRKWE